MRLCTTTPPAVALTGLRALTWLLLLEVTDVRRLLAERQPAPVHARLSEVANMLATLAADSLMKLGRIGEAGAWYGTAKTAADGSNNKELRARVRSSAAAPGCAASLAW